MDMLVSTQWLESHLDDESLVILDCSVRTLEEETGLRNISARPEFEKRHIPGAGFADLTRDLSDTNSDIEFALPAPAEFCRVMAQLGVSDDSHVVLYDDSLSAWAARVWWMLHWIGFDRASILNGGFSAWEGEGRKLTANETQRPVGTLTMNLRPKAIADRDEVLAAIEEDGVCLVDSLPRQHFRGEMALYARPGHIPSAVNKSVMDLSDETGHYKPTDGLSDLKQLDKSKRIITYCGGGIVASATAFNLKRLGYDNVAVYTASLQEWAADPSNPMETTTA